MSFRKYGGINHSAINNIVKSHYLTSDNQTSSNIIGQINSKIVSNSHLDLNKNSLLNVNTIYFDDGTMLNTAFLGGNQSSNSGPLTIDGLKSINGKIEVTYPLNVNGLTTLNNGLTVNGLTTLNTGLTVTSGEVKITDIVTIDKHIFLHKTDNVTTKNKNNINPSIIFYDNTYIDSADGLLWPKTYDTGSLTGICNPNWKSSYNGGGRVGIGTNLPQSILHIKGDLKIEKNDSLDGNIHMDGRWH